MPQTNTLLNTTGYYLTRDEIPKKPQTGMRFKEERKEIQVRAWQKLPDRKNQSSNWAEIRIASATVVAPLTT